MCVLLFLGISPDVLDEMVPKTMQYKTSQQYAHPPLFPALKPTYVPLEQVQPNNAEPPKIKGIPKEIKQFGCMRSGTNIAQITLMENYEVVVYANIGGWKHGRYSPEIQKRELNLLISVKNPYAWLCSAYRFLRIQTTFPEFIRNLRELRNPTQDYTETFKNPIQLWNVMNKHWVNIRLKNHKLFIIRHEDLLQPGLVFPPIERALNLRRKTPQLVMPQNATAAYDDNYTTELAFAGPLFDRGYYLGHSYLSYFTKRDLDFVNSELDNDLMKRLKYEKIT